jgi:hypothetical protein
MFKITCFQTYASNAERVLKSLVLRKLELALSVVGAGIIKVADQLVIDF